jgi:hypothetical protein
VQLSSGIMRDCQVYRNSKFSFVLPRGEFGKSS